MILLTISGPPSSGKTSVILRLLERLRQDQSSAGVIKFDCFSSSDQELYRQAGVECSLGLSGNICPDHYFVSNIEDGLSWGKRRGFDYLVTESAGLCNRCSPHIRGILSVCVVDNLSGVDTPRKIGPMLKLADVVVVTKGDIVSQAEREVFAYRIVQVNSKAQIFPVNGITGQGIQDLYEACLDAPAADFLEGRSLRFPMPASVCSYCLGQTRIGEDYQRGVVRKMEFAEGVL